MHLSASRVLNRLDRVIQQAWILVALLLPRRQTVYLFGCPIHPNMGDQAQTYCIERWLRANYPGHALFRFNWMTSHRMALRLLRRVINKGDHIFCHSGYLMVDHHAELPVFRNVVAMFKDHRIVFFPQTINLKSEAWKVDMGRAINAHPDCVLMCRDHVSYGIAGKLFPYCRLLLFPDVVTSLIGTLSFPSNRHGVLFCIRKPSGESLYAQSEIAALESRIGRHCATFRGDTSIAASRRALERHRERLLHGMLSDFARYRLVITDRYHGTIFSLIAGTPVVVLGSTDHKLSSGVRWFPSSFRDHVAFASDLGEAHDLAVASLQHDHDPTLPRYFQDEFYSKLKKLLTSPGTP